MRVAMVSFEVYPLAKVGGLADVVGTLPKYLESLGIEIDIYMPFHAVIEKSTDALGLSVHLLKKGLSVPFIQSQEEVDIYQTSLPGTKNTRVFLLGNSKYFSSEQIYGMAEEGEQAIFFNVAALEAMKQIGDRYTVVHCHDWQAGLIPVYLKTLFRDSPFFQNILTVFTIHNLGYQGRLASRYLNFAGLPHYLYNVDALEFYGEINLLKGGILFSDFITTVSPTYAQEIQTKDYGERMEGILSIRSDSLYGIINGIDYDAFNPKTLQTIPYHFDHTDISGKEENKKELQKDLGLEINPKIPIMSLVTRLATQKGLDLLTRIARYFSCLPIQVVILGTGEANYETFFQQLHKDNPKKVSTNICFDLQLADRMYSGSDMFLMPSRYEPCGLGQMYSLRMGTIPIVRYTGGLADTVKEYEERTGTGNGFGFSLYHESHLLHAIVRSIYFYNQPDHWKRLIQNAMQEDFSWEHSAQEYLYVYQEGLKRKGLWERRS